MDPGAKPATSKIGARPPAAGKSPKVDGSAGSPADARRAALVQLAAITEILQAISDSPSDVQPVVDAVAERAARLCEAPLARVLLVDGDVLRLAAEYSLDGAPQAGTVPLPLKRSSISGRAVLDRATVHHDDVVPLLDSEYPDALNARQLGLRAVLAVPLMREGTAYGAIFLWRREPGLFSSSQVALVETFAQQVAIAVDNVRLFKQTKVALERQTATSEILRVISQSQSDVQPVFDTIAKAALELCRASSANVFTIDGELIQLAATVVSNPEMFEVLRRAYPRPLGRDIAAGRAVLTRNIAAIPDVLEDPEYGIRDTAIAAGFRSVLSVPLIRDGSAIGAVAVGKANPGPFPDEQVALLQTFADQAVIAIENVRLFDELQSRTRELSESLQQQTATADVLKVISRSAFDLQKVLDTLAESACKLCDSEGANIWRPDGDGFKVAALFGQLAAQKAALRERVIKPGNSTCVGRALLERRTVHIPDTDADPEYTRPNVAGNRAMVGVPLLRGGAPIGVLVLTRTVPRPFTEQQIALATTFADQAVIAIENVRLFNETKEALEQQTATSEILRVISQSQTDTQPVFDTIAAAALKLCTANNAMLATYDGSLVRLVAMANVSAKGADALRNIFPRPPSRETTTARAILNRDVVVIPDVLTDPDYRVQANAVASGFRSVLSVPLMHGQEAIGALTVGRPVPGNFKEKEIALLQTFADQAVIAIENVRLFDEVQARTSDLSESLQQQTATADVLKVISRSAFDLQKVLDTLTESACKLCDSEGATIWRPVGDGFKMAAMFGQSPEDGAALKQIVNKPGRATCVGRALLEGRTVHIRDAMADPEYNAPGILAVRGNRAMIGVPLLREGAPIGVLVLTRRVARPFTEQQIALATTFADQAVIAIENVRLFNETKEALEQQTATSEILRVISQSPRDVQPVFDTIVKSAVRLCEARFGAVFRFDHGLIHLAAHHNFSETLIAEWFRTSYPMAPNRGHVSGRAILTGAAVQVPDILTDEEYLGAGMKTAGFRSLLGVPLLRDGGAIGAIVIYRSEPGQFEDKHIALLNTFADQAVIAIENVRLFMELESRTSQLSRSVGELKALGEVGQAVSSTLELETVLKTIVSRAVHLTGLDGGSIYEYDERAEEFRLQAAENMSDDVAEDIRKAPTRKGDGALGRTAITLEPTQVPDTLDDSYQSVRKELLIRAGYRALLAVPLLREHHSARRAAG